MSHWAGRAFKLDAPVAGGGTLRQHLEAAKRASGGRVNPPELQVGDPPRDLHTVLPIFRHLGARRPYEQGAPLPIRDSEVEAYCRLHRIALGPRDLDALWRLDNAWLASVRTEPEAGKTP